MESEDKKKAIVTIAEELLDKAGFKGEVKFTEDGPSGLSTLCVESEDDLSMLIGKNGQNLSAFEHLVRLMAIRKLSYSPEELRFVVDVNDYRKSRTDYLVGVAKEVARRVVETKKAEALAPMTSYERRLVHTELASYKDIQTESIGQEPRRRIIVKPQPE